MLWAAAVLAVLGGLPQLGIAIAIVVILNAVFSFVQETRADRAAEHLRELLPRKVTLRRDGRRVQIDSVEVVVGDVLVLEAGDRIPADATTAAVRALLVDTSLLTGESEPTQVDEDSALFAGTFVVEGEAEAVVSATGASTRLAAISQLTTGTAPPASPLTRELHRVVRTIAAVAVGVGGVFFVLSLLLGNPPSDGFIFAIGVTVALVPEALLPTVTLSLAWGAEQMAKRQVLVRHLDAVETLGSTTFVCTDKTGTLTRNQMTVVEGWAPAGRATADEPGYDPDEPVELSDPDARTAFVHLATIAARCSTGYVVWTDGGWRPHGDPTEVAIDVFARRLGVDTETVRGHLAGDVRFPFDSRRKRMSVVSDDHVLVKGAPESVLPLCTADATAQEVLDGFTARGLRVLAVAERAVGDHPPTSADEAERDLELLGLLAMHDPPRSDVGDAIAACRGAGVKVAMVTGDHPATAAAIAESVGLRRPGDLVLTGPDLPDDEQVLGALVDRDGVVISRVSPEDKLRIARSLRTAATSSP